MTVRVGIDGLGRVGRGSCAGSRSAPARTSRWWRSTTSPTPPRSRTCCATTRPTGPGPRSRRPAGRGSQSAGGRFGCSRGPRPRRWTGPTRGSRWSSRPPVASVAATRPWGTCAAPMLHVLQRAFGVRGGLLTTVHSYTADQRLQDAPHADLRRARAAATTMIPTSAGAARAVETIVPELAGRLDGPAGADEVVAAFESAAAGELEGYLTCATEPIVSSDVLRDPSSCVFDPGLTRVAGGLVKVFGWYDNEWGYAQRTIDLLELVAAGLR